MSPIHILLAVLAVVAVFAIAATVVAAKRSKTTKAGDFTATASYDDTNNPSSANPNNQ